MQNFVFIVLNTFVLHNNSES